MLGATSVEEALLGGGVGAAIVGWAEAEFEAGWKAMRDEAAFMEGVGVKGWRRWCGVGGEWLLRFGIVVEVWWFDCFVHW